MSFLVWRSNLELTNQVLECSNTIISKSIWGVPGKADQKNQSPILLGKLQQLSQKELVKAWKTNLNKKQGMRVARAFIFQFVRSQTTAFWPIGGTCGETGAIKGTEHYSIHLFMFKTTECFSRLPEVSQQHPCVAAQRCRKSKCLL